MPVLVRAGAILASSHFCEQLSVGENLKIDRPALPDWGFCTSMAMDCCHKEYAEECEILVCVDWPARHNLNLYSRLRFGLLASSWLPSLLGIFLWSALHVMLLIVGGAFWVLGLLTAFLYFSVFLIGIWAICLGSFYAVYGLFALAFDLVLLLGRSIRFCWSLVGFLAFNERIVEWRWRAWGTIDTWRGFEYMMREISSAPRGLAFGVPCMSGSLYQETKDRKLKTWALWCEEVVHVHDVIAL